MPYAKRRQTKRYRKRGNRSTRVLASKALRIAKKAYKLPELKYHAKSITPASVSGTGSITQLDDMNQGTNNNQRIGDVIKPTSMKYRMSVRINGAATDTLLRMIIFRWISEQPANAAEILENVNVTSFKSDNLRYQSQILRDQVFRVSNVEKQELFVRGSVKLSKFISYPQGSSVANRNSIYILFVSDEPVNTPSIILDTRLYYRDT